MTGVVVALALGLVALGDAPPALVAGTPELCGFVGGLEPPPQVFMGRVDSRGLGESLCVALMAPPADLLGGGAKQPLLVLLHGLGATPADWIVGAEIHRLVHDAMRAGTLPPAWVAIPAGRNGYWTDWHDASRPWGSWVVDEVVPAVRAARPVDPRASRTAIAGISMGGFGALSLALRHPTTFGIGIGLSATDMALAVAGTPKNKVYTRVFGLPIDPKRVAAANPVDLVTGGAGKGQRFVLVYGDAEVRKFSEGGDRLYAALQAAEVEVVRRVVPGGHHSFADTWAPESQRFWLGRLGTWWAQASR